MYTIVTAKTFCSVCHAPNNTYEEYRRCQHDHYIERLMRDPDLNKYLREPYYVDTSRIT